MTYQFKPVARKNFKSGAVQYYPAAAPAAVTDIEQVAAEISARCTLTRADVVGVLKVLEEQVKQALISGYTVRLGHLGSFRLTTKAETVDEKSDVNALLVSKARVRYTPSVWIKQKLQKKNINFKQVKTATK